MDHDDGGFLHQEVIGPPLERSDAPSGRLLALCVGGVRELPHEDRVVSTGIFKAAVEGRRWIGRLGVQGDAQGDTVHHGGVNKAVYAYPSEHYPFWANRLGADLPYGALGENLTTTGLLETDVCIGDRVRVGDAELEVSQARIPCYKLELRHGRPGLVRAFLEAERPGIYFRVAREGWICAGDPVEVVGRDSRRVSVARANRVMHFDRRDPNEIRALAEHPAMSEEWRVRYARLLSEGAES